MKNNNKSGRKYVNIMGINVLSTTTSSLLTSIEKNISHNIQTTVLTPNPELILASTRNVELKKALNASTFAIPDGVGLKLADFSLKIIKGRVLFEELVKIADRNRWKIFLLGGLDDEAKLAASKLVTRHPELKILTDPGPSGNLELSQTLTDKINKFAPDMLFVALGNPKQEIWINENAKTINAKLIMAVGGTFRYVAGMSKLPPKLLETLGLEWLWRLFSEPYRFKRIWNAVVVFPLKIFINKLD